MTQILYACNFLVISTLFKGCKGIRRFIIGRINPVHILGLDIILNPPTPVMHSAYYMWDKMMIKNPNAPHSILSSPILY